MRAPGGVERTAVEMRDTAAGTATSLAAAGVKRGDRVAMLCSNRIELLDAILGCAWLGAIAVPLNTAARGPQLEHMLRNSGARLLLVERDLVEPLADLLTLPELERVWMLDAGDRLPGLAYETERAPAPGEPTAPAPLRPGDVAAILYTSGTTGPSKGVCSPHAQFYWFARHTAEHLEITAEDVLFTCLPLFHVNALGTFFQALITGARYALSTRFSASRFWEEITASEATVTYLLGAMIPILVKREPHPAERAHRLTRILGQVPPPDVYREFRERFGAEIIEGYASTETSFVIGTPPGERRPGWMGRVIEGFEARVVDADDADVPDGTPGELVLRHREPFAFSRGYWRMPEATVEAWRNLWFHTGDRVVRDEGGWLRFLDRLKDSIRRRGENVSSYEVEQVLASHPEIEAAAAFPVPSELGEDEVMAAVVPRNHGAVDPLELIRFCEPRLAYFAIPRYVDVVEELPLTENGKPRKTELRERGVSEHTWDLEASGYRLSRPGR